MAQGAGLVVAVDDEQHALGGHDGADADGEGCLRHEVDVVVEEARVGDDGVLGEGFHAGARGERRAGFVERDVSVGTHAAQEEVDAAVAGDFLLIAATFLAGVVGVAVEDVDVFAEDVDVVEEVAPHEGVVALLVVAGNTAVFVHVECYDVLERYLAFLAQLHQFAVHAQGRAAGGAAEHEGMFGGGICFVDAGCDVVGCPAGHFIVGGFDYKTHFFRCF